MEFKVKVELKKALTACSLGLLLSPNFLRPFEKCVESVTGCESWSKHGIILCAKAHKILWIILYRKSD